MSASSLRFGFLIELLTCRMVSLPVISHRGSVCIVVYLVEMYRVVESKSVLGISHTRCEDEDIVRSELAFREFCRIFVGTDRAWEGTRYRKERG